MTDIRPVALPGTQQQFYPQTHVNAVIGLTGQFLYAQVKTLLDWKDIANKPDLVTQDDLKTAIGGIQVPTLTWAGITDKPDVATKADVSSAVAAAKVTTLPWGSITDKPALADLQVDDSGWQSIALINGAKPQADTTNRIRKIGNVVYPEIAANTLPAQGAITQLPVGYRPTQRIWRITRSNAGSQFIEYSIDADGSVFVGGKPGRTLSTGDYIWISEPFVCGN